MAAFAWSIAVPASLYVTRSLGTTINQGIMRNPAPEPLDETIDTAGAIASAAAALRLVPISPTATHLRSLVECSSQRLQDLVKAAKDRRQRTSFSRLFRAPCFREENSRLRSETETLKSRVHLFLTVMSIFPMVVRHDKDDDDYYGEEVPTRESMKQRAVQLARKNMAREKVRASFVRTFARTISADEELVKSCESSDSEYTDADDDSDDSAEAAQTKTPEANASSILEEAWKTVMN